VRERAHKELKYEQEAGVGNHANAMHTNSVNLNSSFPLGFRISEENSVVLRTKFVDTVAASVPSHLLQNSLAARQTTTFNIFNGEKAANVPSKPSEGAENVDHVQAHVTVSAISKKENRAQLLRKIDELSQRIERLRKTARKNDGQLRAKAKAYKEALRKAKEANRAMELHVREQLREQTTQHQLQRRQACVWQLNAKLTKFILLRAFNQWSTVAAVKAKLTRFVSKYWIHGNLHCAWVRWREHVAQCSRATSALRRLGCVLQQTSRHNQRTFFVHWHKQTIKSRHDEATNAGSHHRAAHYYRMLLGSRRRRVFHEWRAVVAHELAKRTLLGRIAVRWSALQVHTAFQQWWHMTIKKRAIGILQHGHRKLSARAEQKRFFQVWVTHTFEQRIVTNMARSLRRFHLRQALSRWRAWEATGHTYWKFKCDLTQRELDRLQNEFQRKKKEWQRLGDLSNRTWQEMIINDRNDRQAEVNEFVSQWKGTVSQAQKTLAKYKRLHSALQERAITFSQISADLRHGLQLQKKCLEYCYEKTRLSLPKVALRSAEMGRNCALLLVKMDRMAVPQVVEENEHSFADSKALFADIAKVPFKLPSTSALASPLTRFLKANPPPVGPTQ